MTAAQTTPLNDRSTPTQTPTSTKILLKKIVTVRMVSESFGGLAQMVERSLSMRVVEGSMAASSNLF